MKNLTQELENAAILKNLVKSIRKDTELDKTYVKVVGLLANKVLASLKENPTIEVKIPESLMDDFREELK